MRQPMMQAAAPFRCEPSRDGAEVTIAVEGELDVGTVCALRAVLQDAFTEAETLLIDLEALAFIDVTGVRLLLDTDAEARERNVVLAVRLGPATHRILDLMVLGDRFPDVITSSPAAPRRRRGARMRCGGARR